MKGRGFFFTSFSALLTKPLMCGSGSRGILLVTPVSLFTVKCFQSTSGTQKKSYQAGLACFHSNLTLGNVSSLFCLVLMNFTVFQQVSDLVQIFTGTTVNRFHTFHSGVIPVFISQTLFRKWVLYLTSVSAFGTYTECFI